MWPPDLGALKAEMLSRGETTTALDVDDARLRPVLNAAVSYVQRVRAGGFNFDGDLGSELPEPTDDLILGTLRLAVRWHDRRRSPDGLIEMEQLGSSRVPGFDPDIDRLLGIGRYRGPVFA